MLREETCILHFIDLEAVHDEISREAVLRLKVYGGGGKLLNGRRTFHRGANAYVEKMWTKGS